MRVKDILLHLKKFPKKRIAVLAGLQVNEVVKPKVTAPIKSKE